MINDSIDFDFAIEKINEAIEPEIILQNELLLSDDMNTTFLSIENSLNTLYEKSRYLQDAIDYTRTFLSLKIKDYSDYVTTIVKNIENIRDVNKNMSYMEFPVKFIDNRIKYADRDGNMIASCSVKDHNLILSNKIDKSLEYKSCTRKNDYIPYRENLDSIQTEPYRTTYIEEKIISNGMIEHIVINLKEPIEMNYIDIKAVNASVENLRYTYVNGVESYIQNKTGLTDRKLVSSIKFDLVCRSYNVSTYSINKNKITDNIWNKVKEYEYNYMINAKSKLDAEAIISRISKKYNSNDIDEEVFASSIPEGDNLMDVSFYGYSFGIDKIDIKLVDQEDDCIFISETINIGTLSEKEYIQFNVSDYQDENCCIEYSILDGDRDVPIIPIGVDHVENERIFAKLPLRFLQDESNAYVIKKNGLVVEISLDDAKTQLIDRYTIDYFPKESFNYTPINNSIKVKAVIRKFGTTEKVPYVESIKIRKYGGELLWMEKL